MEWTKDAEWPSDFCCRAGLFLGLQDAKAADKAAKKAKALAKAQAVKEAKEAEATRGAAGTRKSKAKAEADVKKVRRYRAPPDWS